MRDRLLIRHFLWRFMDHDLISPNADRRVALSAIGGTGIALSLFIAVLLALKYQFDSSMPAPPGIASLNALDDRFLFTSTSMLVMAFAAVAEWDALALDARDTAVLGVLPIPRLVLARAKFIAVGVFALAVLVGWNLFPTLLRAVALPVKLPISASGLRRLTLAQGIVTFGAGAFGFLAVVGFREVLFAILGARRFQAISAALQAGLIVLLTTGWLLLPAVSGGVGRDWLARGGIAAKALPPLWFVGLHEMLAGSVIDDLPRVRPDRFTIRRERESTDLYRSLWPAYRELAVIAIAALLTAAVLTLVASLWNSRRLPTVVNRRAGRSRTLRRLWTWIVVHIVARRPLCQAGFFFTLQTLSRRVSHRAPMAASLAVGVSSVVLATARSGPIDASEIETISVGLFAAQTLLMVSVLSGFRYVTRVPALLRASSTFSLAWSGNLGPYISGVKRAGLVALVVPVLAGVAILHAVILGPRLAALHFGVGLASSVLLLEVLFLRCRRVPLVSSYVPGGDVKSLGALSVVAVLLAALAFAWVERLALETASRYLILLSTLGGLSVAVRMFDRTARESAVTIDFDEQELLPTQRLSLAG